MLDWHFDQARFVRLALCREWHAVAPSLLGGSAMRNTPLILLILSNLVACAASSDTPSQSASDDSKTVASTPETGTSDASAAAAKGNATTVHIRSANAPLLVVFRDGAKAAWQPATMLTANQFTADVHGPYMVGVVCQTLTEVGEGAPFTTVTWEVARTLDDSTDLVPPCVDQPDSQGLFGNATPGATVQSGLFTTTVPSSGVWTSFAQFGSRDVIAATSDKIAIQRDFQVDFNFLPVPTIDVEATGTPLVPMLFDLPNREQNEVVRTDVRVQTATTVPADPLFSTVETDPEDQLLPFSQANVVPSSVLTGPGDRQIVTVTATKGASVRSLSRAFQVDGNSDFTLPDRLSGGQFAFDNTTREVTASWIALPVLDSLDLVVAGGGADPAHASQLELHLSAAFVTATQPTSAFVDTQLPGFQAAWQVDFSQPYTRTLTAQKVTNGDTATSGVSEITSVPALTQVANR